MKIVFVTVIAFIICSANVYGQFEDPTTPTSTKSTNPAKPNNKRPLMDNLVVGGGLDLQFGNYTVLGVTPLIGYAVTDNFLVGSIFTYRYVRDNRTNYVSNTYAVAPFARFFIFKGVFAHAEYEMLNGEFYYNKGNEWLNSFLVGVGYGSRIGDIGFIGFYALWNLTEKENYVIYNQPTFRVSFGIGL